MAQNFGREITAALGVQAAAGAAAAADGYTPIPFYTHTIGRNQSLEEDEVLGEGHGVAPAEQTESLIDHGGDLVVPFDLGNIGLWLRGLLGTPVTTEDLEDTDYTHVFKALANERPLHTLEIKHRNNLLKQHIDVVVERLSLSLSREGGYRRMTLALRGSNELKLGASAAGALLEAVTQDKMLAWRGTIKKGGVAIANVVAADFAFSNNFEPWSSPGAKTIAGYDLGKGAASGQLTARSSDDALDVLAEAGTLFDLEFAWSLATNKSLSFKMGKVKLAPSSRPVDGPRGLQQQFNYVASADFDEADDAFFVATLKNQVASYGVE
jgi:hypothetical protein